ncbi:MAG TPA: GxxExxY protein [Hymenobacter sp.]|jgi:GxxExxY protein|uniref:GxxExxY protein n=1 Tax=Hymenobacter sp. TaxID=1898978 RepID=UPI002EDA10E2
MELNELTKAILGAAFRVHTVLGPGLLESVYAAALVYELRKRGLQVAAEVSIPVLYEGVDLGLGFRADLVVEEQVILELKSVQALAPIHSKQLLNYLKLTGLPIGLLLNFNTISLRDQIVRLVN